MNIYKWRWLLKKTGWGSSYQILNQLKKDPIFKQAHFDVFIPHKNCQKTVIALGQIHTVLSGKISRWTAHKIGKTQARLFFYYRFLFNKLRISRFGEEGITEQMTNQHFRYNLKELKQRLSLDEYKLLSQGEADFPLIRHILLRFADRWKNQLNLFQNNPSKVAPSSNLVHGSLLYSLENPQVSFFAIEGERDYRFVLNKINTLGQEIRQLKTHPSYLSCQHKGFKNLNQEEFNQASTINQKVKLFNTILKSSLRDEATLKTFVSQLKEHDIVVYTIGMAHQHNLFKLSNKILGRKNIALIMIKAPELYFWKKIAQILKTMLWLTIIIGILYIFIKLANLLYFIPFSALICSATLLGTFS